MFQILGTDDAVNACDCCGKSGLKRTVVVLVDGETLHYGSTCATRHTGLTGKEITAEIKAARDGRVAAATKELRGSAEYLALEARLAEARRAGVAPGRAFKDFVAATAAEERRKRAELAERFGLSPAELVA